MNKCMFITTFIITLHEIHGTSVAKEVEGGVQIVDTGPLELIVPEILSFTVKRLKRSQLCIGDFFICYEATSTIMPDEKWPYYNLGQTCPNGYCTFIILPSSAYYLTIKRSDDLLFAQVPDESDEICPRKVINQRQKFIVRKLPDCPVIVNGASLPKESESNKISTATTVGIVAIGVIAVFLLLIIIVVVYYVCIRSNRHQVVQAKSDSRDQRVSKSPAASLRASSPVD